MKTFSAVGALALALAAAPALAADLPSQKGAPAFVAPVAPAFSWTGVYGGVNVGYGWTESYRLSGVEFGPGGAPTGVAWNYPSSDISGVLGGGQIGYNYQYANTGFVVGLEADIQAADLTGQSKGVGSNVGYFPLLTTRHTIDWFGTVRGRVGYAVLPTLLVYGTGGFAYGEGSSRFTYWDTAGFWGQQSESDIRTGWTAGGGVEWAFLPNLSAKIEYLYTELDNAPGFFFNQFNAAGAATAFTSQQRGVQNHFHTVRVGLNYHLNLFGAPAPVVAKY
ncbi:porin family protein [Methylosinus sp. H3A]|uniref:outer membrane protein n=1 Tax=Methylosinus sp. H3A TaxID=2785786 RepID=UPI0018C27B04|nr:outer membrane beta-barrel protein [Methylosinus sp. H3A]MBG0811009.1 porin family protein [Methylosinus sp. H3A]